MASLFPDDEPAAFTPPPAPGPDAPLAERQRPRRLADYAGQQHLVGETGVLRRYRMASLRYGARELASLTWQATMQMKVAVEALDRRVGVHERAVEVNRIENAADDVHDEALRRLFEEERDAITLIKWKEVLDLMEEATDRCEDVANVLESVVVKHG